jgi:hypothetical protein
MSYNSSKEETSVYSDTNSYVNTVGDYNTLGNYYKKPACPDNTTPGTCALQPMNVIPSWGGVGYSIPGFSANLNVNQPLNDSNYFNLNSAYPQANKQPLFSSTYSNRS